MAIGTPVERKAISNASLSTSTWVINPTTPITAGTVAILFFTSGANKTITSVTDAVGNVWTVDYAPTDGTRALSFVSCQVATTISTSTNITITLSNTTNSGADLWIQEVSGLATSSVADKQSSSSGSGKNATSGATPALSQASEIAFGLFRSNATTTWIRGFAWLNPTTPALGTTSALEYEIVSSTAGVTATGTWGANGSWVGAVKTYKALVGGTPVSINVPGAAVATGAGKVSPAEVDKPVVAGASTAAALAPAAKVSVIALAAAAAGAGKAPTITIAGATSVTALIAAASATATPAQGAYGAGAYGEGPYGGGFATPIALIGMSPAAVSATAVGLAPAAIVGQGVVAVAATATSSGLSPTFTFTTVVSAPIAAAMGSSPAGAPAMVPLAVLSTATAAASTPTLSNALSPTSPVATASATALVPAVVATGAAISVSAIVSTAAASTPIPAPQSGVTALVASSFAIAFGGILTAPVVLVQIAPISAGALASPLPPTLALSGQVVASTADAHADALPPALASDLLFPTDIENITLDPTDEDLEAWLTTTVKGNLTLTPAA